MPLIKQSDQGTVKSNIRNGKGRGVAYPSIDTLSEGPISMASRIELEPEASVGFHLHDCDEEVYAIVSGEGIYEFDGGSYPALPGDIFVTKKGMSHGLKNTGRETLVFFAVVAR